MSHVTSEQVGYSVLFISVYVTILCKMWDCGITVTQKGASALQFRAHLK